MASDDQRIDTPPRVPSVTGYSEGHPEAQPAAQTSMDDFTSSKTVVTPVSSHAKDGHGHRHGYGPPVAVAGAGVTVTLVHTTGVASHIDATRLLENKTGEAIDTKVASLAAPAHQSPTASRQWALDTHTEARACRAIA